MLPKYITFSNSDYIFNSFYLKKSKDDGKIIFIAANSSII